MSNLLFQLETLIRSHGYLGTTPENRVILLTLLAAVSAAKATLTGTIIDSVCEDIDA